MSRVVGAIMGMALALVLTVAIEWPIFAWLSRLGFRRTFTFCTLMNVTTWCFAMGLLALVPPALLWIEIVIINAEAVLIALFWKWGAARAFGVSAAMNVASFVLGTLLLGSL